MDVPSLSQVASSCCVLIDRCVKEFLQTPFIKALTGAGELIRTLAVL